jgi:hypothetical protein
MTSVISVIPSDQIDKAKWNNCILQSSNGLIYATSTYLDIMASHWCGIIMNNYEYIMPLPWRKKWGLYYIYPPAFMQQGGIFSVHPVSDGIIKEFINNIPAKFGYCEINLNAFNILTNSKDLPADIRYAPEPKKNYLLPLDTYEALKHNYSRSANRNIAKALKTPISIRENVTPLSILHIHRERFKDKIGATKEDYKRFLTLTDILTAKDNCFTIGAFNREQQLIAGSIYLKYKNRLTFIMNGNSPESLDCGATHLLKDYTIRKFSGSSFILDFEGSDFPDFARFYEQFGAREIEYYYSLVINKLCWPVKFFKP